MDTPQAIVKIGGVSFEREVYQDLTVSGRLLNGGLAYAHTDSQNRLWSATRPGLIQGKPGLGTEKSWWTAQVFDERHVHPLNSSVERARGPAITGPLYNETDGGLTDPPVRLLTGIVRLIKEAEKHGLEATLGKEHKCSA